MNRLVQLTPPGRGAVATVLVEGPKAVGVAGGLFCLKSGKKLTDIPVDRPVFAHFGSLDGEEVIVRLQSATQDQCEAVELHCHGGVAATEAVERAFGERGFALVSWREWIAGSAVDPMVAAARVALADARTERTAAILLDQYQGALRRALENPDLTLRQIDEILERASLGRHLTKPWRVVLMGEPNVGKSSLLNALVGYGRAIVHHTSGTTRDVVSASTALEGWPVELCDTAGLRNVRHDQENKHAAIERAGIELARRKVAEADLLLLIFDAGRARSAADEALKEEYPQSMILYNKADLAQADGERPDGIFVSALTGQGIDELPRLIAARLVPNPPPAGAAVPFTEEQIEMVESCRGRLKR